MKYLIASDIHGSAYWCRKLIQAYEEEKADRLILLGDLLYHGPRNDLPEEYAPKKVIEMLNSHKREILCVRGNCEAEVDQMVLEFPVLAEYALMEWEGRLLYFTHGHKSREELPLREGDMLFCGHTHVTEDTVTPQGYRVLNPGSVSIPKQGTPHGYIVMENGRVIFKTLNG